MYTYSKTKTWWVSMVMLSKHRVKDQYVTNKTEDKTIMANVNRCDVKLCLDPRDRRRQISADGQLRKWIIPCFGTPFPIGSMYAIYGNIYHQYTPNVGIYTIHGSYGFYPYLITKCHTPKIGCCLFNGIEQSNHFINVQCLHCEQTYYIGKE